MVLLFTSADRDFNQLMLYIVAHWYNNFSLYDDSISEVNFLIFVSLWTGLLTIYLAVTQLKFPHLAPAIAVLALDALTMLFWFAGFIALAVYHSNLGECRGRVCDDLVAAIVFGAFNWYVFPYARLRLEERIYWQMLSDRQSMSFSHDVHMLTH